MGVYAIVNLQNDHKYIGQTVALVNRRKNHYDDLVAERHSNKYLQNAFNLYGVHAFEFIVLEYVTKREELIRKELEWIEKFKAEYNLRIPEDIYIAKKSVFDGVLYLHLGEKFERPNWHKFVYGGSRNPILDAR